jgi:hypothetical protein
LVREIVRGESQLFLEFEFVVIIDRMIIVMPSPCANEVKAETKDEKEGNRASDCHPNYHGAFSLARTNFDVDGLTMIFLQFGEAKPFAPKAVAIGPAQAVGFRKVTIATKRISRVPASRLEILFYILSVYSDHSMLGARTSMRRSDPE